MKLNILLPITLLLLIYGKIFSQTVSEKKDYLKNPVWIQMMDDSTTNYFEAEKAFNEYWSIRPVPSEENKIIGERHQKNEKKGGFLGFKTKKEKLQEESEKYAFQYKKFKRWQLLNLPYVQPDGRILTTTERLKIFEEIQKTK